MKKTVLTIQIGREEKERLRAEAKANHRTMSQQARYIIEEAIKRKIEKPNDKPLAH